MQCARGHLVIIRLRCRLMETELHARHKDNISGCHSDGSGVAFWYQSEGQMTSERSFHHLIRSTATNYRVDIIAHRYGRDNARAHGYTCFGAFTCMRAHSWGCTHTHAHAFTRAQRRRTRTHTGIILYQLIR